MGIICPSRIKNEFAISCLKEKFQYFITINNNNQISFIDNNYQLIIFRFFNEQKNKKNEFYINETEKDLLGEENYFNTENFKKYKVFNFPCEEDTNKENENLELLKNLKHHIKIVTKKESKNCDKIFVDLFKKQLIIIFEESFNYKNLKTQEEKLEQLNFINDGDKYKYYFELFKFIKCSYNSKSCLRKRKKFLFLSN